MKEAKNYSKSGHSLVIILDLLVYLDDKINGHWLYNKYETERIQSVKLKSDGITF